ncbi:neurogenic locus notch homolog 1-like, partial [Paramuricea clavata]
RKRSVNKFSLTSLPSLNKFSLKRLLSINKFPLTSLLSHCFRSGCDNLAENSSIGESISDLRFEYNFAKYCRRLLIFSRCSLYLPASLFFHKLLGPYRWDSSTLAFRAVTVCLAVVLTLYQISQCRNTRANSKKVVENMKKPALGSFLPCSSLALNNRHFDPLPVPVACDPNPCQNAGTCFMGAHCEVRSQCEPNPCKNGGSCYDVGTGYECTCSIGFKGSTCEDKNKCHPNPCRNGGICTGTNDVDGFECLCREGYKGKSCEADTREKEMLTGTNGINCQDHVCHPSPCQNSGTCLEERGSFRCVCGIGYHGNNCEYETPCISHPCLNGGTCIDTTAVHYHHLDASMVSPSSMYTNGYYCKCSKGYTGTHCEDDSCSHCHFFADCVGTRCHCKEGYHGDGKRCHKNVCHPNPCKNSGKCVEAGDSYDCDCSAGYTGPLCQVRQFCLPNPCKNEGVCVPSTQAYSCSCKRGFKGDDCSESDVCNPNPCQNSGTCREENNAAVCACAQQFEGKLCEVDKCAKCAENAHCEQGRCVCNDGYQETFEKRCEIQPGGAADPCTPNRCKNGGVCHQPGRCECPEGYDGKFCEDDNKNGNNDDDENNNNNNDDDNNNNDDDNNNNNSDDDNVSSDDDDNNDENNNDENNNDDNINDDDDNNDNNNDDDDDDDDDNNDGDNNDNNEDNNNNSNDDDDDDNSDDDNKNINDDNIINDDNNKNGDNDDDNNDNNYNNYNNYNNDNNDDDDDIIFHNQKKRHNLNPNLFVNFSEDTQSVGRADPCSPSPCKNNGVCSLASNKPACTCPQGFSGDYCQVRALAPKSQCHPNPCQNAGTCRENGPGYDCICTTGYKGPHCEIDECEKCDPHAICVSGHCKCRTGYIGNGYECVKESDNECDSCSPQATCKKGSCICLFPLVGDGQSCSLPTPAPPPPPPPTTYSTCSYSTCPPPSQCYGNICMSKR